MTEGELLRKNGFLYTEKQFRIVFSIMAISLIGSLIVFSIGTLVMLISRTESGIITGITILVIGLVLLFISAVFTLKKAGKIQMYLMYRKNPKEFETEIDIK